jgi:hypothetical protein
LCRLVAKKAGLAGKTEEEEIFADVILEHVNDFIKGADKIQKYILVSTVLYSTFISCLDLLI